MINQLAERTVARFLGVGSAFVAVIVVTGTVTDPVNVTKLFALAALLQEHLPYFLPLGFVNCGLTPKRW